MPVTVIVGGQFGSEGKGKVAHHLARQKPNAIAIRVGSSNSGHTAVDSQGVRRVFRLLPTPALLPSTICILSAGSYIDVDILLDEIEATNLTPERLFIDPNAYLVTADDKLAEQSWQLGERIGSTQSGTGAAIIDRIRRQSAARLVNFDARLSRFVRPVRPLIRSHLDRGGEVIVEGTQGFGLSLLHALEYPKATSRDTTAGTFVAESGLSPLDVAEIVMVIRAFPIRVSGDSGHLPNQIDWETIRREGGWRDPIVEYTSVTKKIRRVGRFDAAIVRDAITMNQPTQIVLNHADYFDAHSDGATRPTRKVVDAILTIEEAIGRNIDFIGLGPSALCARATALDSFLVA